MSSARKERWLLDAVRECADRLGWVDRVHELLTLVVTDKSEQGRKTFYSIGKSKNLGNHITACLSDWLERYRFQMTTLEDSQEIEENDLDYHEDDPYDDEEDDPYDYDSDR